MAADILLTAASAKHGEGLLRLVQVQAEPRIGDRQIRPLPHGGVSGHTEAAVQGADGQVPGRMPRRKQNLTAAAPVKHVPMLKRPVNGNGLQASQPAAEPLSPRLLVIRKLALQRLRLQQAEILPLSRDIGRFQGGREDLGGGILDRKSTRLNSSH